MMNVKETLKRLHKKLPAMGLDELFELLDCYVEQSTLSTFPNWDLPKWNSITCTTTADPSCKIETNATNGKLKYYDGGGSTQLIAEH